MQIKNNKRKGAILLNTLVFGLIAVAITTALTSWFAVTFKGAKDVLEKELAFHIAESGVEYYRWHLAHAPTDFQDGTGQPGPYVHDFLDKEGVKIGEFSLNIIAPANGSTVVTVESTGTVASTSASRTIRATLAKPSFAKFAFVANDEMRFGEGTEVFGPIHSNDGIRFDGLAHNLISSARETYDDPDHSGGLEWAVHTHLSPVDPLPPTAMPDRFDVFEAGRQVGVPAVDFDGLTSDLAELKSKAQEPDGRYFGSSGRRGYRMVLKTDGSFDMYRVRSLRSPHWSCNNALGADDWSTWSIRRENFLGNYSYPNNGIIFVEDHLWVEGTIDDERLTIAAARFPDSPNTRRNIIVNNDVTYTNHDGTDVLALIAQRDVNVGMYSEDNLEIDAALVAQKGRVGRHYYRPPWWWYPGCSPYHDRNQIDLYGMIGTNQRYGFAYTDNTGYDIRNITYDANLLYGAPPEFPITSEQYEVVTWEEI